ncbi:MAG: hypothetical protein JSU06_00295 [Actinobacteria bacterium]|nr:hypothetical protein [Actinomycetota bacterium]
MSRRGRETRVSLDGLTGQQVSILRRLTDDWLIAKAADLPLPDGHEGDPGREIEEVAALGRLASGLREGGLFVPDAMVRDLVERSTTETRLLEELEEEYENELAEHDAWTALLARLSEGPPKWGSGR